MKRRIFVDTEWTKPPWSEESELMWIGLADEKGRTWYSISSEATIEPPNDDFIAKLFTTDEPRLTRQEIASGIAEFCGQVDEFWAWIPTQERFLKWFKLGEEGTELFNKYWNVDLQMLYALIDPWPESWPKQLLDLNAAAVEADIRIPPRAENHLHPRVHTEWNRDIFKLIEKSKANKP